MTFELLPTAGYWAVAFLAVAVVAGLAAIAVLGDFLVRNHTVRVERRRAADTTERAQRAVARRTVTKYRQMLKIEAVDRRRRHAATV